MENRMQIGSEAHKELFCRSFIMTHREYDPEKLPWPRLDGPTLERLQGLPFWGEAITTEMEAGAKIRAYAAEVRDPLLREAIALQAAEELRHATLIETLIARYDIRATERRAARLPTNPEQDFVDIGYGECIDSFFAFGLFEVARQSGFFPKLLLDVVEPIVDEEARHIVFFVNWEAYHQSQRGRGLKILRATRALRHYSRAIRLRLGAFHSAEGAGFTASGSNSIAVNLTAETFLSICLRENAQRLAGFDRKLLRPWLVPTMASLALRSLRLFRRRTAGR